MNLPNKLTIGRIILVPFFVAVLLIDFPTHNLIALAIFIIASITDMLDGKIARSQNLVTDFGKFADPLADKILVLSALLCFIDNNLCASTAVIIILIREFTVTSVRLIAASKGEVVAANIWGKVKTVTQIIAIISVLAMQSVIDFCSSCSFFYEGFVAELNENFLIIGEVLIWISAMFSVISGVIYIIQNKHIISDM